MGRRLAGDGGPAEGSATLCSRCCLHNVRTLRANLFVLSHIHLCAEPTLYAGTGKRILCVTALFFAACAHSGFSFLLLPGTCSHLLHVFLVDIGRNISERNLRSHC